MCDAQTSHQNGRVIKYNDEEKRGYERKLIHMVAAVAVVEVIVLLKRFSNRATSRSVDFF